MKANSILDHSSCTYMPHQQEADEELVGIIEQLEAGEMVPYEDMDILDDEQFSRLRSRYAVTESAGKGWYIPNE